MKARMFFGVIALTFAFASAFAFKSDALISYGYWDGEECKTASPCTGTAQTCQQTIDGQLRNIREFTSVTSCGNLQTFNP